MGRASRSIRVRSEDGEEGSWVGGPDLASELSSMRTRSYFLFRANLLHRQVCGASLVPLLSRFCKPLQRSSFTCLWAVDLIPGEFYGENNVYPG